jgi:CO dehydrogenase/acetyl-CoA synthase beta subunit
MSSHLKKTERPAPEEEEEEEEEEDAEEEEEEEASASKAGDESSGVRTALPRMRRAAASTSPALIA